MYEYTKFHRGYYEAIEDLDEHDQLVMFRAICKYGLYEEEPELRGTSAVIWKIIKPMIDGNHKNVTDGKKGGRPKAKKETTEVSEEKTITKKLSITKKENYTEKEIVAFKKESLDMLNENEIKTMNETLLSITSLNDEDLKVMTTESKAGIYKSIRTHIRKVENIYSTSTSKQKSATDETTKALHEKASKKQRTTKQKYEDFWDDYEDKVFIYDGEELYVDGDAYEIVLNKDRNKKPYDKENKIIMAVINEEVDFIN